MLNMASGGGAGGGGGGVGGAAGSMDPLDTQDMMKQQSAFMELQQQAAGGLAGGLGGGLGGGIPHGMSHHHPAYQIRAAQYGGGHHQHSQGHDSVFSGAQHGRGLGYPFGMNGMGGNPYGSPGAHPFSVSPYQTPSPPRDGEYCCKCPDTFVCLSVCLFVCRPEFT
ncbi:homeobox protein dlx1a-like isoform x1 [Plakobranchus ocellatus]|uniref:Homeobox protein dlx1a-like isoform x1 n=1 Tax=Plakobranchus ocellatus TaxID=259542 RepID=A0AAV4DW41_9GAST|nr:homeobox protein dlx1a-like isoform x1 [Plakobranchus ocellatus]